MRVVDENNLIEDIDPASEYEEVKTDDTTS